VKHIVIKTIPVQQAHLGRESDVESTPLQKRVDEFYPNTLLKMGKP